MYLMDTMKEFLRRAREVVGDDAMVALDTKGYSVLGFGFPDRKVFGRGSTPEAALADVCTCGMGNAAFHSSFCNRSGEI